MKRSRLKKSVVKKRKRLPISKRVKDELMLILASLGLAGVGVGASVSGLAPAGFLIVVPVAMLYGIHALPELIDRIESKFEGHKVTKIERDGHKIKIHVKPKK